MKWIKLFEEFQMGDLNFMSPEEIQKLFMRECGKETPDLNLIRVILDNGLVDVNAKDNDDFTPLHWAKSVAIAEYLISAGADVNYKNGWGYSPLHYAVGRDNIAIAKRLISAGANVNAQHVNPKGKRVESPLALAVRKDNVEMQALLQKHGATL